MTTRYPARGASKEKDSKFDDSGIFKLFSPAEESTAHTDSVIVLDKQLGQKALHLPPLRVKTIRHNKTATSLRGITSESLKQILKESIHFSERLSDVQQAGESMSHMTQCLMHQNPQLQPPSLLVPAPPQTKLMAPVDVKNFQLSLAPPSTMGRVGKPSRLVVSNQTSLQNGIQLGAKQNMPSGLISQGTLRASARGRKVAVKYFGFDKSEQGEFSPDSGRTEAVVESARSQISVTCFDFKPTSYPHVHMPALRRSSDQDMLESRPSIFPSSEPQRPSTSNTKVPDTSLTYLVENFMVSHLHLQV